MPVYKLLGHALIKFPRRASLGDVDAEVYIELVVRATGRLSGYSIPKPNLDDFSVGLPAVVRKLVVFPRPSCLRLRFWLTIHDFEQLANFVR